MASSLVDQLRARVRTRAEHAATEAARRALPAVKEASPRPNTGRLNASWVIEPRGWQGDVFVVRVANTARTADGRSLAAMMDEGTRPHPIEGNPLLVFFWPRPNGPGRVVYLRHVDHPGTVAYDFMKVWGDVWPDLVTTVLRETP